MCSQQQIGLRSHTAVANNERLKRYFWEEHGLTSGWFPYSLLITRPLELGRTTNVPVNTLDFPALEFEIARLRERGIDRFKEALRSKMSLNEQQSALGPMKSWDPIRLIMHVEELLGESTITSRWIQLAKERYPDYERRYQWAKVASFKRLASSGSATAHHKLGYQLKLAGDLEQAIKEFQRALEINPSRDNSHFNIAACQEKLGRHEQALQSYKRELTVDPKDDDIPYRLGRVLLRLRRFEEALVHLDQALEKREDYADVQEMRGWALKQLGRKEEAITAFSAALLEDPEQEGARKGLARLKGN